MRKAVVVSAALGLAAVAVWAGPQGAPFRVSSCANCRQESPAVAGSPSGGFLAVWEGASATDLRGISGRLYTPTAPAAADFPVSKNVAPDQYDADVARDNQGNYVVVWSEVANGNSEIMAQRLQANGTPLGAAFKVNQDAAGTQTIPADFNPAVAATKGGFVVVWLNLLPAGNSFAGTTPQVLARRFNAAGVPLGPQSKLSTGLVDDERPDVCVDSTDRIIAVWTNVDQFLPFQQSKLGISMRRLSPAGAPLAPEEVILKPAANLLRPAVSCGSASTFVVVWHSDLPPAVVGTDIIGQRFSRLGRKTGAAFRINTLTTNLQMNPAISHDAKGNFVVVWQGDTGAKVGIFGRRFTAAGAAAGPEFEVFSDAHFRPLNPAVAHTSTTGNFVVVWQSAANQIFARRYTP